MAINQNKVERVKSIDEHGNIVVQEFDQFIDSVTGQVIAEGKPNTRTITPDADVSAVPAGIVKDVAQAIFTPARKAAYAEKKAVIEAAKPKK